MFLTRRFSTFILGIKKSDPDFPLLAKTQWVLVLTLQRKIGVASCRDNKPSAGIISSSGGIS